MKSVTIVFVVLAVILSGCTTLQAAGPAPTPTAGGSAPGAGGAANMPNPASVYCTEQGGAVEIRTDAAGAQYGVCRFPDGSECDEWAYFRGKCVRGLRETKTGAPSGAQMTEEQARAIATRSDACTQVGQLTEKAVFNPNSQTWWIDLDGAKQSCNPACAVGPDGTADVNWRCTGMVPPAGAPAVP